MLIQHVLSINVIKDWSDKEFDSNGQIERNEKNSEGYEWIEMVLG